MTILFLDILIHHWQRHFNTIRQWRHCSKTTFYHNDINIWWHIIQWRYCSKTTTFHYKNDIILRRRHLILWRHFSKTKTFRYCSDILMQWRFCITEVYSEFYFIIINFIIFHKAFLFQIEDVCSILLTY